jgi:hypothetical protein
MQVLVGNVSALAVAAIFYTWRAYRAVLWRRERQLRERVTYMLWVMAQRLEGSREVAAVE